MKRILLAVTLVMCIVASLALVACTPVTYTLTLYDDDATTVLDTITVEEGKAPERPANPEKANFEFVDWFVTPTNATKYDFSKVLTEDAAAYARWKSAGYEDTRTWVMVGSGIGWTAEDAVRLTKKSGEGNVFEVTIDVNLGDEFKFTVLNSDGVLDYNNADGANVGFDAIANPGEYIEAGSGIGDAPKNAICSMAGNYTFTVTTDPVNANNSVTVVRNGDVVGGGEEEPQGAVTTFYIKGEKVTDWKDFIYSGTTLKEGEEGIYTLSMYMLEGDSFMFATVVTEDGVTTAGKTYIKYVNLDDASKELLEDSGGNMITKQAGMYTFTYTEETAKLNVTVDTEYVPEPTDYYIDGTFADGVKDWEGYCFNEQYKFVQDETNPHIYTIDSIHLTADKEFIIQAFKEGSTERGEWGTDTYNGLGSYNYFNLLNGGDNFSAVSASNNNIKILKTSDYKITFNSISKMISVEDLNIPDDVYVYGTMTGAGWAVDAEWKMTYDADALTYTITKEFTEGDQFGLRICVGNDSGNQRGWVGSSNVSGTPEGFDLSQSNIACTVTGTYTLVLDMSGETPVLTITAA